MTRNNNFKTRSLKYLYQERHTHQMLMVEFGLDRSNGFTAAHNLLGRMYHDYYKKTGRNAYPISTVRDEWRSRDKATKPVELWSYITAGVYTQAEIDMRDKLRKLIFYYAAQSNCHNYLANGPMTPISVTPIAGSLAETLLQTQGLASIQAEAAQLLASNSLPDAAGDGLEDEERNDSKGSRSSCKTRKENNAASAIDLTQGDEANPVDLTEDDATSAVNSTQGDADSPIDLTRDDVAIPINRTHDDADAPRSLVQNNTQFKPHSHRGWGGLYDGDDDHLHFVPSDLNRQNQADEGDDQGEGDVQDQDDDQNEEGLDQDEMSPSVQNGSYLLGKHDFSDLRKFREQHAAEFPYFAGGSADEL